MPSLPPRLSRCIAALTLAIMATACSEASRPTVQEPTAVPGATEDAAEPGATEGPDTARTVPPAPTSSTTDAAPVPIADQVDARFDLAAGEQIEDEQGNLISVYGVAVWPQAYVEVDPFQRADVELFGDSETAWAASGPPVALDVGICAPSATGRVPDASADFIVSADAEDPDLEPTAASRPEATHPLVEPMLVLPEAAQCSRGWILVAGDSAGDPRFARYLLSLQPDEDGEVERYLYQWEVDSTPVREAGGQARPGQTVTFNDGPLAGVTVQLEGWAELVDRDAPAPDTRLVGVSAEICTGENGRWPEFGLAIDGWNLASRIVPAEGFGAAEPAPQGETCSEGWLEFAVPLGARPTAFFASDGADPIAGFASWSLTGGALPTPQ